MFHYRICGLPNVWLVNGYQWHDTNYGPAIGFTDIEGLQQAIARELVSKGQLTGAEFRYLRKAMDLSQADVGRMFGNSDQTVALWEKGRGAPQWAQGVICALYREQLGGRVKFSDVFRVARAKTGDRKASSGAKPAQLYFEKPKRGAWRLREVRQRAAA
ncbi:MAG: helix-turn-helix domain-containing protein [Alphaproteobacteria bacterium]|nr:helix-turn-helix domain-containing protein [Alphaproteobacteria bacterium]